MKIGIGSYTYVWWAGVPGYPQPATPLTPDCLIEMAVQLGAGVVQFADNLPLHGLSSDELLRLRRNAGAAGIEIEAGTRGIQPGHLRQYLSIAKMIGAKFVRTLLDSPGHEPSPEEAASLLREIAADFEAAGVTLGIENHDRFKARQLRDIINGAGNSHIGVCLDTANSLGCGEGIDQVLDVLADRVCNVHIKDFVVRRLPHNKGFIVEGAPAGSGLLDIPTLLKRIPGHSNAILEQWPSPGATIDDSVSKEKSWAQQGIKYLRDVNDYIRRSDHT